MSSRHFMTRDLFDAIAEPEPPSTQSTTPSASGIEERVGLVKPPAPQIHPAIREVLGETVSSMFESQFHLIEIADGILRRYVKRYPSHAQMLNQAFLALQWHLRMPVRDELYRAHVEELLQRVIAHQPLDEGTSAEVLLAICDTSLRAPLISQAGALAEQLFLKIFGPDALGDPSQVFHPPWKSASEELLHELRRKIRVPSRQLSQRKKT